MAITRAGETFSGYNKPKRSRKGGKKFAVLAKQGDTVKLIRFGDANMSIKKSNYGSFYPYFTALKIY